MKTVEEIMKQTKTDERLDNGHVVEFLSVIYLDTKLTRHTDKFKRYLFI